MPSVTSGLRGRLDESVAAAEEADKLAGRNPLTLGMLGRACGLAGRIAEVQEPLRDLEVWRRSSYLPPSSVTKIYRGR